MLVLLDLDNTLGNRSTAVQAWVNEFCAANDLGPAERDWILEADNDGYSARATVFGGIRDRYKLTPSVDDLVAAYQERVIALASPTPGAYECLTDLRLAGWTIAIVTNGSTKQQHGKIDAMGLRSMVDAVIVSGDLDIKKPDVRIYEAAAAATGEDFDGAWMVGDSALHDVVGAQAFGMKTAWLHRGRTWPDEYKRPTVILDDLTQLVSAVDAHR